MTWYSLLYIAIPAGIAIGVYLILGGRDATLRLWSAIATANAWYAWRYGTWHSWRMFTMFVALTGWALYIVGNPRHRAPKRDTRRDRIMRRIDRAYLRRQEPAVRRAGRHTAGASA